MPVTPHKRINEEAVSQLFNPTDRHASEEAAICLHCTDPDCKGDCKHFKAEHKKLLKGGRYDQHRKAEKP